MVHLEGVNAALSCRSPPTRRRFTCKMILQRNRVAKVASAPMFSKLQCRLCAHHPLKCGHIFTLAGGSGGGQGEEHGIQTWGSFLGTTMAAATSSSPPC
jgi:hypothetical protein